MASSSRDILPIVKVNPRKVSQPGEILVDKILKWATKDDLIDFMGLDQFRNVEKHIKDTNEGKFKLSLLKDFIMQTPELLNALRTSQVAVKIYDKYVQKVQK